MSVMNNRPSRRLRTLLAFPSLIFIALPIISTAQTSTSEAIAPPTFEVAAIKPNNSGNGNSGSDTRNGVFTATNVSLKNLIQYEAYDIPASRILGGPKWLDSTRFDIQAKTDETVNDRLDKLDKEQSRIQTRAMFQQLLADRFQLKVHWETRELPVYALVATKSGAKLQPTKDTSGNTGTSVSGSRTSVKFTATGVTLEQLAQSLTSVTSQELGRDVIDKTGIPGRYDISLNWAKDTATTPDNGTQGPSVSIFTAIQEQLGLKLESSKGPVQVLVIDKAEMPSDN